MTQNITSSIVQAYSLCPRKAHLLLHADSTPNEPHEYVQVLEQRAKLLRVKWNSTNEQKFRSFRAYEANGLFNGADQLVTATLEARDLVAHCDGLTKARTASGLTRHTYEPMIIVGTHSVTQEQKVALSFCGFVLGELQSQLPVAGSILNAAEKPHRVRLSSSYRTTTSIIETLRGWVASPLVDPPPVILNPHCPYCPFRKECRAQAIKADDLSLLDRITPKVRKKYQKKGIFTVEQLSYVFRPRRRKKGKSMLRFSPELQALAIRTNKIYLQHVESHERPGIELFLDIEGVPDEHFNYLIGLLIIQGDSITYRSFWADNRECEKRIWTELLEEINHHPGVPVYHYGRYESKAINTFIQRYGGDMDALMKRLVNVNSWIYGKVYFPVRSNSLKEIGKFVGAHWSSPNASGLQALAWRHRWEETADGNYKQLLLRYNEEDCRALHVLVNAVSALKYGAESKNPSVELANQPKQHATHVGEEIHRQFDWICRSARADYDRNKIALGLTASKDRGKTKLGAPMGHQAYQRIAPGKARKIIRVRPCRKCPRHRDEILRRSDAVAEHTVIDLAFSQNGCRKFATTYVGAKGYCPRCNKEYKPPAINKLGVQAFGHGFRAWGIHQKIVLRLPYRLIIRVMEDMFGESVTPASIVNFITSFAKEYAATEDLLVGRILKSPFIHVDETRLNIQGVNHYVWVFTDGKHVVFRLTETRQATVAHEFLKGYTGVLVSDFYPGYDSVKCLQQKCLVHLIRDLNDDLWGAPFNTELELFVTEVRNLLVPILQTVERRGLKKRYLNKFKKSVDRFYRKTILAREYESEVTRTYQKRFQRYRDSLFLFLERDNIPWNNNMGERAIRELSVQRKISGTFFKSLAPRYLLLLGIAQSCRFQEKSFLKFLVSHEKDVDGFKATKLKKMSAPVGSCRSDAEEISRTESLGIPSQQA